MQIGMGAGKILDDPPRVVGGPPVHNQNLVATKWLALPEDLPEHPPNVPLLV